MPQSSSAASRRTSPRIMFVAFGAVKQFLTRKSLFSHDPNNTQNTHFPAEKRYHRVPADGSIRGQLAARVRVRCIAAKLVRNGRFAGISTTAARGFPAARRPDSLPTNPRFSIAIAANATDGAFGRPELFPHRYSTNLAPKNLRRSAKIIANSFEHRYTSLVFMKSS
jgi:hypothetical protein